MRFPVPPPTPAPVGKTDAQWIWKGPVRPNVYVAFRKSFTFSGKAGVTLRVSAVTRFRIWVNGSWVGDGPPPAHSGWAYADDHAIGDRLCAGRNTVTALVHFVGNNEGDSPGFWLEIRDTGGNPVASTDGSWEAWPATAWREETFFFRMNRMDPCQEFCDSRKLPKTWPWPSDDADWQPAAVLEQPPVEAFHQRGIPQMLRAAKPPRRVQRVEEITWVENRIRPDDLSINLSRPGKPPARARVENPGALTGRSKGPCLLQCSREHLSDPTVGGVMEPALTLDFVRQVNGCLEIEVDGAPGTVLDFGFADQLLDGRFNNSLEGQIAARLILRGGRQIWRMFTWRSWRYLRMRVGLAFEPVRVHRLEAVTESYPTVAHGKLLSSDSEIEGIYKMCRETCRLGAGEIFYDSPWREQAQWLGDIAGVGLDVFHAIYGDFLLPSKFLYEAAVNQREDGLLPNLPNSRPDGGMCSLPMPDYSLHWVRALWRFYLNSGSLAHLEQFLPVVRKMLSGIAEYLGPRGLLEDLPWKPLIDWMPVQREGCAAPINALFGDALLHGSRLAAACGDDDLQRWCGEQWESLRHAFNRHFWEPQQGRYADGLLPGGPCQRASEHANAAAILAGFPSPDQCHRIVDTVFEHPGGSVIEAQPFFSSFVLEALDSAGRFDLALRIIRQRWGRRIRDKGFSCATEEWTEGGSWRSGHFEGFLRSRSHLWSAAPAFFLPTRLAGLEILEPGGKRIRLAPRNPGFDYRITYPLATGLLRVSREQGQIKISAPKQTEVLATTELAD
jgi:alpha-L-rhamnosidase